MGAVLDGTHHSERKNRHHHFYHVSVFCSVMKLWNEGADPNFVVFCAKPVQQCVRTLALI